MSPSPGPIAVVGGGLVGASLALALAPLGYEVVLLEAVPARADVQPSYDDRTLALGGASCRILQGLDLWEDLKPHATAIRSVVVSELGQVPAVTMDAGILGLDAFGHVVEARAFGQAIQSRVAAEPRIRVLCPVEAETITSSADHAQVVYRKRGTTQQLEAALVIGADGADSLVRRALDIPVQEQDYGQTALIANVTPEKAHEGRAFERMTPTGPFALLPHRDGRCGLVWCVESDQAPALMDEDEEAFLKRATHRSGRVLGALTRLGTRTSYPLRQVVPERDVAARALLMGNAAHAIHPVGAQGFNLGLRDVACFAEVLADTMLGTGTRPDPGGPEVLARYSKWRQEDQRRTLGWTDDMVHLFASDHALTRLARGLSLSLMALSPALQRRLAIRAMGYRGRVPRLAQGEALWQGWGEPA